jgi:hypothetical protein
MFEMNIILQQDESPSHYFGHKITKAKHILTDELLHVVQSHAQLVHPI